MSEGKAGRDAFDLLEKKVVFRVSRTFFWILCAATGLGFAIAVIVLLVNIIPPAKKNIPDPALPAAATVSLAEVQQAIAPPAATQPGKKSVPTRTEEETYESEEEFEQPPPDPLELRLNSMIDSLRTYFPEDKYNWQTEYGRRPVARDYWGRVTKTERYVVKYGLSRALDRVLDLYENNAEKIPVVENAIGIIAQIEVDKRGKAFKAYSQLRQRRDKSRQSEIHRLRQQTEMERAEAQANYEMSKTKKAAGAMNALKGIGGAFVAVALIGLFLCFLAIERNTRMLKVVLEGRRNK